MLDYLAWSSLSLVLFCALGSSGSLRGSLSSLSIWGLSGKCYACFSLVILDRGQGTHGNGPLPSVVPSGGTILNCVPASVSG